MRTTIELTTEHRARLVELAARRGHKGFSAIVGEAIECYLQAQESKRDSLSRVLGLRGSISDADADRWRTETQKVRSTWR